MYVAIPLIIIVIYNMLLCPLTFVLIEVIMEIGQHSINKALHKVSLDFDDINGVIETWGTVVSALELPGLALITSQNIILIMTLYLCLGGKYQIFRYEIFIAILQFSLNF